MVQDPTRHAHGLPAGGDSTATPSAWIRRWSHLVPPGSAVLDVACGSGRHMAWFAARGHATLGVDREPLALRQASAFGGVLLADLETQPWPLEGRRFGAVVVTNYLWRPLLPALVDSVADGGVLLIETFAHGQQTIGRPRRAEFLLQPGELLACCAPLRVVAFEDGHEPGPHGQPVRFVQRIAARRTAADAAPAQQAAALFASLE